MAGRISGLARRLQTSKKRVIEEAVTLLESSLGESASAGFLDQSFGAWQRDERAQETVEAARAAFRESFQIHTLNRKHYPMKDVVVIKAW